MLAPGVCYNLIFFHYNRTYLIKTLAESCRFVEVCITCYRTTSVNPNLDGLLGVRFEVVVVVVVTITENIPFADSMSGIRPPDCSKLARNPKNDNDVTVFRHDVTSFFWRCFASLVKFSYLSKFHVNIITSSGIMTIFFYKGLTRNPEIGNTPVWVLSNIWRLGRVMGTKIGTKFPKGMLLNTAKFQGYSFYCS